MPRPPKFTEGIRKIYLKHLAKTGSVESSCAAAGVTRETVRGHREDEGFAQDEQDAKQAFIDTLESEAVRRGRDGVIKPVFFQGERVDNDEVREYSDMLLIALLKRHNPEWREKQTIDMHHSGGVLLIDREPTPEEWEDANKRG